MVATSITTMGTGTMGAAVGANTSAVEVVVVVSVVAVDTATRRVILNANSAVSSLVWKVSGIIEFSFCCKKKA